MKLFTSILFVISMNSYEFPDSNNYEIVFRQIIDSVKNPNTTNYYIQ
jgi:hypothetical protein